MFNIPPDSDLDALMRVHLDECTTVELLDMLAWWVPGEAAALGRTLCDIRELPEIAPCDRCDCIGAVPVEAGRPWTKCPVCRGWGFLGGDAR